MIVLQGSVLNCNVKSANCIGYDRFYDCLQD